MGFFWRPSDYGARIVIFENLVDGDRIYYTCNLRALKIRRDRSCLQLDRLAQTALPGTSPYTPWARINFSFHERMVLFYATFVALKYQDRNSIPHPGLEDALVLDHPMWGEKLEFSGQMEHEGRHFGCRLWRDVPSGVLRIEVTALRGRCQNVPIWTAFINRYAGDPDWAAIEGGRAGTTVTLAALRDKPKVFSRFQPLRGRHNCYVLPFTSRIGKTTRRQCTLILILSC